MLTTKLIHPDIISALSYCGHGSKILIGDGNYPIDQKSNPEAIRVYLGVTPGLPTVTDVLKALHSVCEFEKAEVMTPGDGSTPEIFAEFEKELGLPLEKLGRYEYYDMCMKEDIYLAISTGEKRVFSNIVLTVGCA